MNVKQAMHKGVTWVEPDTPVDTLAIIMREDDIGAIPVGENDRLIGMVTDRDIVCRCIAAGLDPKTATARDVMTEGIVFCLDKQELDDAARIMEMKKIRRLPVINGKKRMIGILSLGDVHHTGHGTSAARLCTRSQLTRVRSVEHEQVVVPNLGRAQSRRRTFSRVQDSSRLPLRGLVREVNRSSRGFGGGPTPE